MQLAFKYSMKTTMETRKTNQSQLLRGNLFLFPLTVIPALDVNGRLST